MSCFIWNLTGGKALATDHRVTSPWYEIDNHTVSSDESYEFNQPRSGYYSVQGLAGHATNSLLINNAPAVNSIFKSLIRFMNFATDTVK